MIKTLTAGNNPLLYAKYNNDIAYYSNLSLSQSTTDYVPVKIGDPVKHVVDTSGHGFDLKVSETDKAPRYAFIDGRPCLHFDGVDDYMELSGLWYPLNQYRKFTVECWFKVVTPYGPWAVISTNCLFHLAMHPNYQTMNFIVYRSNSWDPSYTTEVQQGHTNNPIDPTQWHHYAGSFDLDTNIIKFYIDGVLVYNITLDPASQSILGKNITDTNHVLHVGHRATSDLSTDFQEGYLGHLRLWSTVRTNQEIIDNRYNYNLEHEDIITNLPVIGHSTKDISSYRYDEKIQNEVYILKDKTNNHFNAIVAQKDIRHAPKYVVEDGRPCLYFDGVDDYLEIPDGLSLLLNNKPGITVECYVKIINEDMWSVISCYDHFILATFNDKMRFITYNNSNPYNVNHDTWTPNGYGSIDFGQPTNLDFNQWCHVAGTFDVASQTWKLYLNGILLVSYVNDLSFQMKFNVNDTNKSVIHLMHAENKILTDRHCKGYLTNVRIWDRTLSLSEVIYSMNTDNHEAHPNLICNLEVSESNIVSMTSKDAPVIWHSPIEVYTASGDVAKLNEKIVIAPDLSGFNNHAHTHKDSYIETTYRPTYVNHQGRSALYFDGQSNYLEIGVGLLQNMISKPGYTIEGWFYIINPSTFALVSNYNHFILSFKAIVHQHNEVYNGWVPAMYQSLDFGIADTNTMLNQWIHLACTFDESTQVIRLYSNSVLLAEYSTIANGSSTILNIHEENPVTHLMHREFVDLSTGTYFAEGYISQLRVWDKALTQFELNQVKDSKIKGPIPNLIGAWM